MFISNDLQSPHLWWKEKYYETDCRPHFWEIYDQCRKSTRVMKLFSFWLYLTLEPGKHLQRSFFAKILNGFKLLTIFLKKCSIADVRWMFKVGFWLMVWNIELTYSPCLRINLRKYSAAIYVRHHFWKGGISSWESKQNNECLCRSSLQKVP